MVNRTDQTDAGMNMKFCLIFSDCLSPPSVGVYKAVADNGTGKPVETVCTLTVGSMYFLFAYVPLSKSLRSTRQTES